MSLDKQNPRAVSLPLDEALCDIRQTLINNGNTLDEKLHFLTRTLALTLSCSRTVICFKEAGGAKHQCLSLYDLALQNHLPNEAWALGEGEHPHLLTSLNSMDMLLSTNPQEDIRTQELSKDYWLTMGTRSLVIVPLRVLGKTEGFIGLELTGDQDCDRSFLHFMTSVAQALSRIMLCAQQRSEIDHIRYCTLYENTQSAVFLVDDTLQIFDCNQRTVDFYGAASKNEILGRTPLDFSPERQPNGMSSAEYSFEHVKKIFEKGEPQEFDILHHRLDKSQFWAQVTVFPIKCNEKSYLMSQEIDITSQVEWEQSEEVARKEQVHKSLHDPLTGLSNRKFLFDKLVELIKTDGSSAKETHFSLLVFDLNQFREVNNTLGHSVGDQVLKSVSLRLRKNLQTIDASLFRLGGDEFAVVLSAANLQDKIKAAVTLVNDSLKKPVVVGSFSWQTSASIGIAKYPEHGRTATDLLRFADVAMYAAKSKGEAFEIYDPAINFHSKRRLTMMTDLGGAIRDNALQLYYQPRIDLRSGELSGCEALIRWNHPKLGLVPPFEFIPLAEVSDLIHALTFWVADQAMAQAKTWRQSGVELPIAINVSARNLTDPKLPNTIAGLLAAHELEPNAIELEITESALMDNPARALETLQALSDMGLALALDDFGTGYSSLSYLKKLPISVLKIDRSFVRDLVKDKNDLTIVKSTISLAHNFSLDVVAEGIEDAETLDQLRLLGCDQAQGYHIARPLPIDEFKAWFEDYSNNGNQSKRNTMG